MILLNSHCELTFITKFLVPLLEFFPSGGGLNDSWCFVTIMFHFQSFCFNCLYDYELVIFVIKENISL